MTPITTEFVKQAPLGVGAMYLSFVSEYGVVVVTTLSIIYGVMQMVFRVREHRKIMKEKSHVQGDRE